MWVANRPFYHRGKFYQSGDPVPAEGWGSRTALIKLKRIRKVDESAPEPKPVRLADMHREDLNALAIEKGIEDPTAYRKKDELVAAIEALDNPPPVVTTITTPVTTEESEASVVEPPVVEPPVTDNPPPAEGENEPPKDETPQDDLFADTGDGEKTDDQAG